MRFAKKRESIDEKTDITYSSLCSSLRLYPPIPSVERVAAADDVLPLRHPIRTPDGRVLTELPIRKGQVRGLLRLSNWSTHNKMLRQSKYP
jgi:hypothetical protein